MQKRGKLEKLGLVLGVVFSIVGLYKLDIFLYPTLDYFGKYVFFGLLNIFSIWLPFAFYKAFSGYLKFIMPLFAGFGVLLIGVKFA